MADAEAQRETAERRRRVTQWSVLISSLLIALLSFAVAVSSASSFLVSARADTARGARADLDAANVLLVGRGLPVYEQPRPDAPNYLIQRQASRAWARVDYPEDLAEQIREDVRRGRRPVAEPAATLTAPVAGATPGDAVVTIVPINPGPTLVEIPDPTRPGSAPTGPTPAAPDPRAPASLAPVQPAPAPTTSTREPPGLLPLLPGLPVDIPLLSR